MASSQNYGRVNRKKTRPIIALLCLSLLFGMVIIPFAGSTGEKVEINDKLSTDFWDFDNQIAAPQDFLQVRTSGESWALTASLALVPVQNQRYHHEPLLFLNSTTAASPLAGGAAVKDMADWGATTSEVMNGVAQEYWTKAELMVVASDYEAALWATPLASFLEAPLVIQPSAATITALSTKSAILVGSATAPTGATVLTTLATQEDVWRFQLLVYESKGIKGNYIVITNPTDVEDREDLLYPNLSPGAGILAAQRRGIILTNNYTIDKAALQSIGVGTKDLPTDYAKAEPAWKLVHQDVKGAAKFMMDMGHTPTYLALVGDGIAIPDYYLDFHIQWVYWNASQHYPPSQGVYGILDDEWNWTTYQKEDLAVGRVVTSTFELLSNYLVRVGHYDKFLPGGDWSTTSTDAMFQEALVVDGHRINQPDPGGPPWTADKPWPPAGEMRDAATAGGFNTTYVMSRNASIYNDTNPTTTQMLDMGSNSSLVLVNVHGTSPGGTLYYRVDKGKESAEKGTFYTVEADKVREHPFNIPTVISVVGCNLGTHASWGEPGTHLPVANLDIGAAAYVGTIARQSICYAEYAPFGPCAAAQVYTWENITKTPQPIGPAYAKAKLTAYETFYNATSDQEDLDPYVMHLFGDPALIMGHPTKAYPKQNFADLDVAMNKIEDKVTFTVSARDPATGTALTPTVQMKMEGITKDGASGEFDLPDSDTVLEITATMSGYEDLEASVGVAGSQPPAGTDDDDDDDSPAPGLLLTGACLLIAVWAGCMRKRH